jgi:hypothetical protein
VLAVGALPDRGHRAPGVDTYRAPFRGSLSCVVSQLARRPCVRV